MTVHQKLPCIRCHMILHPETEKVYQDTKTFKAYVLRGKEPLSPIARRFSSPSAQTAIPKRAENLRKFPFS